MDRNRSVRVHGFFQIRDEPIKFGLFRLEDFLADEPFVLEDGSVGRLSGDEPEPGQLAGCRVGSRGNAARVWRSDIPVSALTEEAAKRVERRVAG